jgi:hypothetical protein
MPAATDVVMPAVVVPARGMVMPVRGVTEVR